MFSVAFVLVTIACCGADGDAYDASARASASRSVAVTIDDLPLQRGGELAEKQETTVRLLGLLNRYRVPAIGFVNEQNLGEPDPRPGDVALLEAWLEAGMDLGNHTYSHPSLYETPLEAFKTEVLRGEEVTARLLEKRGRTVRYFRHPYLNTGPDLETRAAFETFLTERSYEVAPVTISNDEWLYGAAYDRAGSAGDTLLMSRIGDDYIRYMNDTFAFYERLSRDLLDREPAQILLIHANKLNARYFGELAQMMLNRGYQFVSLETALQDPAYALPDTYVGRAGISWLQRWWITQGHEPRWDPDSSEWVRRIVYPDGG